MDADLRIEKVLDDHERRTAHKAGEDYFTKYALLKKRVMTVEYTQTMAGFPTGNDHGPQHVLRVLEYLDGLLGDEPLRHLGAYELFLSMMSVLYHDVGMLLGREEHAKKSEQLLALDANDYVFDDLDKQFMKIAVRDHSSSQDIEKDCRRFDRIMTVRGHDVRIRTVAALVRLADELDEDIQRAPKNLESKRVLSETSKFFWAFNQRIWGIKPKLETSTITINMQLESGDIGATVNLNGEGYTFVEATMRKLRKFNDERAYCNRFLPDGLKYEKIELRLQPVDDLWEKPWPVMLVDGMSIDEILEKLPPSLLERKSQSPGGVLDSTKTSDVSVVSPDIARRTDVIEVHEVVTRQFTSPEALEPSSNAPVMPRAILFNTDSVVLKDDGATPEIEVLEEPRLDLLTQGVTVAQANAKLRRVPRHVPRLWPQHAAIRAADQGSVEQLLGTRRVVWITADWGLGKDGFVAACLDSIARTSSQPDMFRINCENVSTIDGVFSEVQLQLHISLQELGVSIAALPNPVILFDNISFEDGLAVYDIEKLVQALADFAPSLRVLLACRRRPPAAQFPVVEIRTLDEPDCGRYLENHPDGGPELTQPSILEKLYTKSEGVPMHLDRMLKELQVVSIGELSDFGTVESNLTEGNEFPKALVQSIASLSASGDRHVRRSLKLLKILTVLSGGDTLANLKRFDPAEPLYPEHVEQLRALGLLEVAPLNVLELSLTQGPSGDSAATSTKLLLVPRLVRDYMRTKVLSAKEHRAIVRKSLDHFFGPKWTEGEPSFHFVGKTGSQLQGANATVIGPGNPYVVLVWALRDAGERRDTLLFQRLIVLAQGFVDAMSALDLYRDMHIVCDDVIRILDANAHSHEADRLSLLHGIALRMMHRDKDAQAALERALGYQGEGVSNEWRARVNVNLAMLHERMGNNATAASYAREAERLAVPESATAYTAQYLLATLDSSTSASVSSVLGGLESKARKKGFEVLANTIAIDLADRATDREARLRLRNRVLESKGDYYNVIRAIIDKVSDLIGAGRVKDVTPRDRKLLVAAYSYLYGQRMGSLFDECHNALWMLEKLDSRTSLLFRLFRFSSFLWRIFNKPQLEQKCLLELQALADSKPVGANADVDYVYYSFRIQRARG